MNYGNRKKNRVDMVNHTLYSPNKKGGFGNKGMNTLYTQNNNDISNDTSNQSPVNFNKTQ